MNLQISTEVLPLEGRYFIMLWSVIVETDQTEVSTGSSHFLSKPQIMVRYRTW